MTSGREYSVSFEVDLDETPNSLLYVVNNGGIITEEAQIAQNNGADVIVNWFYEEDDEDMRETGEDYEEILGLNFNYIPV